jgi:hypothetical protein
MADVHKVTCATCNRKFDACCFGETVLSTQGYNCSVQVYHKDGRLMAIGYYGSKEFDGHLIDLTESQAQPNMGLACDDCIQAAVNQGGQIKETELYFPSEDLFQGARTK